MYEFKNTAINLFFFKNSMKIFYMFKIAFLIFLPSLGTHISVYLIGNVSVYFVREPVTQKNEDNARSMHYKSPSSSNIRRLSMK